MVAHGCSWLLMAAHGCCSWLLLMVALNMVGVCCGIACVHPIGYGQPQFHLSKLQAAYIHSFLSLPIYAAPGRLRDSGIDLLPCHVKHAVWGAATLLARACVR